MKNGDICFTHVALRRVCYCDFNSDETVLTHHSRFFLEHVTTAAKDLSQELCIGT